MHPILVRQLKRAGVREQAPPTDPMVWDSLLATISGAYEQGDQDRYLLERSLALSSEEMSDLHRELAAERDTISAVICSLGEGICAVNNAGEILFINPEARRMFGMAPGEPVEGRELASLVSARTPEGIGLDELLRCEEQASREDATEPRLIVADDQTTFVTYSVTPLGEQREGSVLTLRDVTGRKRMERERQELNRRLVEVSRQAGMAEVASDVLHNVGNVLNSVTVSCSVTLDAMKSSRCTNIQRVAGLLAQNKDHLGEYLTSDPAGSKIPQYLERLGEHLLAERERLIDELEGLQRSIQHISEIIAAQQSLAKVGGISEMENLAELMEEALRVIEPSLVRHGVTVVRDFQPTELVCIERHQALHIFVNLLNNAKQACASFPPERRSITIRIYPEPGHVVTRVIDQGCGIPTENLSRIFAHGFTTRPDGHGFGLHSAALAAKAMGGEIRARSDGMDRGAEFILKLPTANTPCARVA